MLFSIYLVHYLWSSPIIRFVVMLSYMYFVHVSWSCPLCPDLYMTETDLTVTLIEETHMSTCLLTFMVSGLLYILPS